MLKSGAFIDKKDADGKTVLHRAVEGGHVDMVQEILKIKPSLKNETDNKGKIPQDYANDSKVLTDLFKNY